ncbi:thioredoxin family protein [Shewanella fidelis]|uniref:Thioredoxin family protein n=1 Tax=Shewanella fidelis TaxID=173509 RepID=A0AAW8NT59_9GAMM|nr:thioredoxin family protein [Shewanella fidelis]MDR8525079.1 thioredoxin family protein [Shewanella fidelis]MDW4811150.1 thioredoxin family protein [Shewanella fidelis]MDW4815071.1 thioredoxin family protein [Shewanella fidelis]MDW4819161.1 thioredoxin family protein [Shewanella fidelis]MDW4823161.1 thioredoxin family protein [Shewanella fidelis]
MARSILLFITLVFACLSMPSVANANTGIDQSLWHYTNAQGELKVKLYFFWSKTCPHCAEAHPFIDSLPERYPWIEVEDHMITDADTMATWQKIAKQTGTEARSVPYFASGEKAVVGYSSQAVTGEFLVQRLKSYYVSLGGKLAPEAEGDYTVATPAAGGLFATCSESDSQDGGDGTCDLGLDTSSELASSDVQPVELPLVGVVHPEQMSLPLLTVVLAGVDAFNPCAFFVLLFLLSIMVNAKSRARMLIVGGIFVFFSGFIYFIFMSAWLNIFQLLGAGSDGGWIILGAGMLALVAGAINIKDYFFTKGEVTLSMSAENRTGLIKRMGKLTSASSMTAMIAGTVVLSILANAYELLCTAGFPMIYTSVLSMHDLETFERYMYLVMYNVVYVIPLAAIVIAFSVSLGKRKLTEKEGQTLKLMSGIMMMGLGGMLALDPTALQNVALAIGLIFSSIILTVIITLVRKSLEKVNAKKS